MKSEMHTSTSLLTNLRESVNNNQHQLPA
jgi:hypothetical protein